MSRDEEALERAKAQLRSLSQAFPELIERIRELAAADGRDDVASALPDPETESQRLTALAAYLDHYGRVDAQTFGPVHLQDVVEEAVALARGEIERKGTVAARCLPAPLVRGNPRQLGQVFISMLINAAQSLPAGAIADNYVAIELDTSPEGWARVAIADSGSGIAVDVLPHIFEPLYSTKRGKGMGIGLAVCREIITGLGGRISVESAGRGTLFIVELPPAS